MMDWGARDQIHVHQGIMLWAVQCWPEKDEMSRIIASTATVAGLTSAKPSN